MKKTSKDPKMYHDVDPECITAAGNPKESDDFMSHARFMTVSKTFKQMMETPKVDCMIMTRETFKTLEKCLVRLTYENQTIVPLSGIKVYFHRWLGDLIVYGDSTNKVIRRIIETCEGNGPLSLKGGAG